MSLLSINSSSSSSSYAEIPERHYGFLLLTLIPALSVFGNMLVILAVSREKCLQSATNYFIVSLAVADLLVSATVMPFAVYVQVNGTWGLSTLVCDVYIAADVTSSTSSIFNLVAISVDRHIAVTRPIKYAKHKNNSRVVLTIVLVWFTSAAIGVPIVLGLNVPSDGSVRDVQQCIFYNSDFIIYSSLFSFFIPCVVMVFLYYNIFKAIRERSKRKSRAQQGGHKKQLAERGKMVNDTAIVLTNQRQSQQQQHRSSRKSCKHTTATSQQQQQQQLHETALVMCRPGEEAMLNSASEVVAFPASPPHGFVDSDNDNMNMEMLSLQERQQRSDDVVASYNTENNDEEYDEDYDDDEDYDIYLEQRQDQGNLPQEVDEREKEQQRNEQDEVEDSAVLTSAPSTSFCHIIINEGRCDAPPVTRISKSTSEFEIQCAGELGGGGVIDGAIPGHNTGSCDRQVECQVLVNRGCSQQQQCNIAACMSTSDKASGPVSTARASVIPAAVETVTAAVRETQRKSTSTTGRFALYKKTQFRASRNKREKPAAKRERKATKTLAIVLGVFLVCWVPFFTCNVVDAICMKLKSSCSPGLMAFFFTSWIGYMNSFANPVIYTIFNNDFRKAFKRLLGCNR